jgi:hypothetical protein
VRVAIRFVRVAMIPTLFCFLLFTIRSFLQYIYYVGSSISLFCCFSLSRSPPPPPLFCISIINLPQHTHIHTYTTPTYNITHIHIHTIIIRYVTLRYVTLRFQIHTPQLVFHLLVIQDLVQWQRIYQMMGIV